MPPLFEKFIRASKQGKRRLKNGNRINPSTIKNYENTLRLLNGFLQASKKPFTIAELKGNNKLEFNKARKIYGKFYEAFCSYLASSSSSLNYTGQNIKIIRTFMGWCNSELGIHTGPFYKNFYVLKKMLRS